MLTFSYICPDTGEPIDMSVLAEDITEVEPVRIDACPCCGEPHNLGFDDLVFDPGDGEVGVREPRRPFPANDVDAAEAPKADD